MAQYYNITVEEMDSFLLPQGFKRIELPGTSELVYGKRIDNNNLPLTLRVYTGIDPTGLSREVGKDAMRVNLFTKIPDPTSPLKMSIKKLFGSKRVHRVAGWKKNLQDRINEVMQKSMQQKICDKCGSPMVLREGKSKTTGKPYSFYGCSAYPSCTNTKQA